MKSRECTNGMLSVREPPTCMSWVDAGLEKGTGRKGFE